MSAVIIKKKKKNHHNKKIIAIVGFFSSTNSGVNCGIVMWCDYLALPPDICIVAILHRQKKKALEKWANQSRPQAA